MHEDSAPEPSATVAYGPHPSQFLELYRPAGPGPHPVVVLIHGGFWRLPWGLELMRPLARDLVARGYAAANLEYRRLGEAGGGWPGTCEDVADAVRALADPDRQHDLELDPARGIGLVGHSAGGHLALWVAARLGGAARRSPAGAAGLPVAVVVSQAGVADLRAAVRDRLDEENGKPPAALEFLGMPLPDPEPGPVPPATPGLDLDPAAAGPDPYTLASPIELLPLGPRVRQLVLHGDADNRVPQQQSVDYTEAARQAGDDVAFVPFTGMGHFELIDPEHESWHVAVRELDRVLRPAR
jgi:acetyl esterase/lipase